MNWRVFGLASLAAAFAGVIAGLAPGLFGARFNLARSIGEMGRGGAGGSRVRRRVRQSLVVAQVAGCVVLLVFAGLFTRSVRAALASDLGFRTDRMIVMDIDATLQHYDATRGIQFFERLRERAAALPGVRGAAYAAHVPFSGSLGSAQVSLEVPTAGLREGTLETARNFVSDGYFSASGFRLIRGREFTARDNAEAPRVVVVNEAFAERFWPNEDPVGKRLRTQVAGPLAEVVGVVANSKFLFVTEATRLFVYEPMAQAYQGLRTLHLFTDAPVQTIAAPLRQLVRELDANMLVFNIRSIESHLRDGIAFFFIRLAATLAAALGVIGLIQALVGLYGVLAFAVGLRTRELGMRMALGASRARVLRSVFAEGGVLVGAGLAIGIALAFVGARLIRALLIGVSSSDLMAYAGASLLLAACAFVACYIPARRAARLDPVSALRYD
jgi:putative ABC transport system permease protein